MLFAFVGSTDYVISYSSTRYNRVFFISIFYIYVNGLELQNLNIKIHIDLWYFEVKLIQIEGNECQPQNLNNSKLT